MRLSRVKIQVSLISLLVSSVGMVPFAGAAPQEGKKSDEKKLIKKVLNKKTSTLNTPPSKRTGKTVRPKGPAKVKPLKVKPVSKPVKAVSVLKTSQAAPVTPTPVPDSTPPSLGSAPLSLEKKSPFLSRFDALSFQIGGNYYFNAEGDTLSPDVTWTPTFHFNSSLALRGNFGASLFKGKSDHFLVTEYLALLKWNFIPTFSIAVGPGAQTWFTQGTYFVGRTVLAWEPETKLLKVIDRIYGSYSIVPHGNNLTTSGIQFGIGVFF